MSTASSVLDSLWWFSASMITTIVVVASLNHLSMNRQLALEKSKEKQVVKEKETAKPSNQITRPDVNEENIAKTEDVLSLNALAELTKSDDVNLHDSAVRILLDRAMSHPYLTEIIKAAGDLVHSEIRQHAIATIQQLTKEEGNKKLLVRMGILKILVETLKLEKSEASQRYIVVSLFRLVSNNDYRKKKIVKYGVLKLLIEFLTYSPTHNNDLKYWSLLLVHQFSLTEELHGEMISKDMVPLLAKMARLTFGNTNMQKLCLHSLVRLVSSIETSEAVVQLNCLMEHNMVSLVSSCLKNEDAELVTWAAFLMHEFVIKDVGREEFGKVKGILKAILQLLISEDNCIPRIILRTLKCLGVRNESFQLEMINNGVIKKVIACVKMPEEETQYWALALLHDLLSFNEGHEEFLENKGLSIINEICINGKASVHVLLYIADILVYICSSAKNHVEIARSNIVDAVSAFCKNDDPDPQYAGAALLLNLSSISDDMIDQMAESGALEILADLVLTGSRESVQTVAAKSLTTIAKKVAFLRGHILKMAILPLVSKIITCVPDGIKSLFPESLESPASPVETTFDALEAMLDQEIAEAKPNKKVIIVDEVEKRQFSQEPAVLKTDMGTRLVAYLDCLYLFLQPDVFDFIRVDVTGEYESDRQLQLLPLESILKDALKQLTHTLMDVMVLPLITESMFTEESQPVSEPKETSPMAIYLQDRITRDKPSVFSTVSGLSPIQNISSSPVKDSENEALLIGIKDSLSAHALCVLGALFKFDVVRSILLEEKFFTLLVALVQEHRQELMDQSMVCFSLCSRQESVSKMQFTLLPFGFTSMIKALVCNSPMLNFYGKVYLEQVVDLSINKKQKIKKTRDYVRLNQYDKTPNLLITKSGLDIRNDSWTFESIRGNRGLPVGQGGKYGYEVVLRSDGIVQIGWATLDCNFDPEAGFGVGDDGYSYAFDGHRKKKWHGLFPKDNEYGEEWMIGDTITTLINLDQGTISYYRNGFDLGIAFTGINLSFQWFPAISMASGQGCKVCMGYKFDEIQYLPIGYTPMAHAVESYVPPNRQSPDSTRSNPSPVESTSSRYSPNHSSQSPSIRSNPSPVSAARSISPVPSARSPSIASRNVRQSPVNSTKSNASPTNFESSPKSVSSLIQDDHVSLIGSQSSASPQRSASPDKPLSISPLPKKTVPSPIRTSPESPIANSPVQESPFVADRKLSPTDSEFKPNEEGDLQVESGSSPVKGSFPSEEGGSSPVKGKFPADQESGKSETSNPVLVITTTNNDSHKAETSPIRYRSSDSSNQSRFGRYEKRREGLSPEQEHSIIKSLKLYFYLEIQVGFYGSRHEIFPILGIYNRDFAHFFLVGFRHRLYLVKSNQDPEDEDFYTNHLQPMLEGPLQPISPSGPIEWVQEFAIEVQEGDVIGFGGYRMGKIVTLNGSVLEQVENENNEKSKNMLWVPFLRNTSRFYVNYGQEAFEWEYANSSREELFEFMDKP